MGRLALILCISRRTVIRSKQRFVQGSLEVALTGSFPRERPERRCEGLARGKLIHLACSQAAFRAATLDTGMVSRQDGAPGLCGAHQSRDGENHAQKNATVALAEASRGVSRKKQTETLSSIWHSVADGRSATSMKYGGAESASRTCIAGAKKTSHCICRSSRWTKTILIPKRSPVTECFPPTMVLCTCASCRDAKSSQVTTDFLQWLGEQVQAKGKQVLVLIWDYASQAG